MIRIDVDVTHNNWEDIKYGGPQMLGFTFFVQDNIDKEDYENTIRSYLSKNELPCLGIRFNTLKEYKIWSKEEIINCINENKNSF